MMRYFVNPRQMVFFLGFLEQMQRIVTSLKILVSGVVHK